VDRDARAAISGLEHGIGELAAGLVIAPEERANVDRALGVADAIQDGLNRDIARAEHPQLLADRRGRCLPERLWQPDRVIHLVHVPRSTPARPERGLMTDGTGP